MRRRGEQMAENALEAQFARNAAIDARAEFSSAYDGRPRGNEEGEFPGVRNVTRLGPESLQVVPVHVSGTNWRLHPDGSVLDTTTLPADTVARAIVQRQLRLSRHDVVKALRATEPPPGWAEHPWLRHLKVLTLEQGSCTLGGTHVGLDPELGVTYRAVSSEGEET